MYSYFNILGSFDTGVAIYAPVMDWFVNPVLSAVLMSLLVSISVFAFGVFIKFFNSGST